MHLQTLQDLSLDEIADCHNLAFSDYIVPLQITAEHLAGNILANSIDLKLSPGAFDNGKLVGFMLIGIHEVDGAKAFYNGGTGVIPDYRGRRIVNELYQYLLPKLIHDHVDYGVLEVVTKNTRALRIYESIGYSIDRKLLCFKGTVGPRKQNPQIEIKPIPDADLDFLKSFWDWQPSWQNQIAAVRNMLPKLEIAGAFINEELAGYIVYNPLQKRIQQFAVNRDMRSQGIGTALFSYIGESYGEEMAVINVDERAEASIQFLQSIGLNLFAEQFEMKLRLGPERL